jgi:hypothetical protein
MGTTELPGGGSTTLAGLAGPHSAPPLGKINEYGSNLPSFKLLRRGEDLHPKSMGDVMPRPAVKVGFTGESEPDAMQLLGETVDGFIA